LTQTFNDAIKSRTTKEFHSIIENQQGLHVLTSTPRSGQFFFVKYITQHFQTLGINVLLSTTMGTTTLHLCFTTIVHIAFCIPMRGYLSIMLKPNNVIEKQKITNVIIINEMSMMTNNIFCVVE